MARENKKKAMGPMGESVRRYGVDCANGAISNVLWLAVNSNENYFLAN